MSAQFQRRIIGKKGARDDGGRGLPFSFYDHPGRCAHHVLWRHTENAPTAFGYFRHIVLQIHFREQNKRGRVVAVNPDSELSQQAGEPSSQFVFTFLPQGTACDGDVKAGLRKPCQTFDHGLPRAWSAHALMMFSPIVINGNA